MAQDDLVVGRQRNVALAHFNSSRPGGFVRLDRVFNWPGEVVGNVVEATVGDEAGEKRVAEVGDREAEPLKLHRHRAKKVRSETNG